MEWDCQTSYSLQPYSPNGRLDSICYRHLLTIWRYLLQLREYAVLCIIIRTERPFALLSERLERVAIWYTILPSYDSYLRLKSLSLSIMKILDERKPEWAHLHTTSFTHSSLGRTPTELNFKKWARRNYVESLVCFYVENHRHLLLLKINKSHFHKKM